jgi:putative aminopeptidase FrvX
MSSGHVLRPSATSAELLRELSDAFGPSGFEGEVRGILRKHVIPSVEVTETDRLGNFIAIRQGKNRIKLMLDAHMDEIGFMVSHVGEDGFLRFTTIGGWDGIGGWDTRIVASHTMTILSDAGQRIKGIIGTHPPAILSMEERAKTFRIDDLFVDIGATSAQEVAAAGIRVGSPGVIAYPFERLNKDFVAGKALDNRAGCAVLAESLQALANEELDITLVANFAACEEVGLRGARTAAYSIEPDIALVIECTVAADVPGIAEARQPARLAKGPALTVADQSLIVSPRLLRTLAEVAREEAIPFQYKRPPFSVTDGAAIQQSRGGILVGVVSVPCRYIHSPFGVMRLDDLANTVNLVTAFVRRCGSLWAETLHQVDDGRR